MCFSHFYYNFFYLCSFNSYFVRFVLFQLVILVLQPKLISVKNKSHSHFLVVYLTVIIFEVQFFLLQIHAISVNMKS